MKWIGLKCAVRRSMTKTYNKLKALNLGDFPTKYYVHARNPSVYRTY